MNSTAKPEGMSEREWQKILHDRKVAEDAHATSSINTMERLNRARDAAGLALVSDDY